MHDFNVSENEGNDLVHYETGVFIKTYVKDGAVYYATFHPELYPEGEGLDATGRYLVVLLQPSGLSQVYLNFDGEKWYLDDDSFSDMDVDHTVELILENTDDDAEIPTNFSHLIAPDLLQWLSDAIIMHNKA